MPTAIVAGLPPDTDRRVQQALKEDTFPAVWRIIWVRSNGRMPGLAPGQLKDLTEQAANTGGAHVLIFQGREKKDKALVRSAISPYFRLRWIEVTLLKLIPHSMEQFLNAVNSFLQEELEWAETVQPKDNSSCLLLPECAFSAAADVQHISAAASERGIERIKLAARGCYRFDATH